MRPILFLPILFLFVLLMPSGAPAQQFVPVSEQWSLDDFTVQLSRLEGEDDGFGGALYNLRVLHGQEEVAFLEGYPEHGLEVSQVRDNAPRPGCRSLWVSVYSGGAHCCFEDLAMFSCPDGDLLASISLGDSGAGDLEHKGKDTVLPVLDWGLAYYAVPGDVDLFIPFAFSPAMARYLIFTPQGLTADEPGRYPGFHAGQLAETKKEEVDPEFPGTCLKAAYHAYMIDGDRDYARQALVERLPEAWMAHAEAILEDVVQTARDFNPVENFYFPK